MFSVIVPAHNEEANIGRCLESLLSDAHPGELEVIVVCNGCRDATASIARSWGPPVRVIETEIASKYRALRAGEQHATSFPRFYVDADVVVRTTALREVARVLEDGAALVAAPRLRVDLAGRPWHVRSYYRLWTRLPYVEREMVGTGVYALSEAGRKRFDEFPDMIADDQFVLGRFDETERASVGSAEFVISPPRTLRDLVRTKTRAYTGNRELALRGEPTGAQPGGRSAWMGVVRDDLSLLSSVPAYLLVCAIAEARSKRQVRRGDFALWERDASTRSVPAGPTGPSHPQHGRGRLSAFVRNVTDPRSWLHLLRIVHYYSYSHVRERPKMHMDHGARIAPNVSLRNGERIWIGARSNIGERCALWAGDTAGRITIGTDVILAPQVFVTASNYQFAPDSVITSQPRAEADVIIGNDVWIGAGVVVVAGVTIGDGCVVGAGAVVSRSLPPYSIAGGVPARVLGSRLAGRPGSTGSGSDGSGAP